jgi:hypothetical protein
VLGRRYGANRDGKSSRVNGARLTWTVNTRTRRLSLFAHPLNLRLGKLVGIETGVYWRISALPCSQTDMGNKITAWGG